MSTPLIIVIVVGGTAVFAGVLAAVIIPITRSANRDARQRTSRFRAAVADRGWRYEEHDDSYAAYLPPYWVNAAVGATPNRAESVDHVTTGDYRGWQFLAAQFHLAHGDSPNMDSLAVHLPRSLPRLAVNRMTSVESRVNRTIGRADRQFENDQFNEHFDILTDNERFATDVLTPRLMEFLLTDPAAHGRDFWIYDSWIYFSRYDFHVTDDGELLAALDFLTGVLERIPPFVTDKPAPGGLSAI